MKFLAHIFRSPVFYGALFVLAINSKSEAMEGEAALAYDNLHCQDALHFPNPIKKLLFKQKNNKVAAALAFPFPFGCVGLHRVYLGTDAHVPIVYAATAGGVFGIIPLLDCIVLLSHKDISGYENNGDVIMWIRH